MKFTKLFLSVAIVSTLASCSSMNSNIGGIQPNDTSIDSNFSVESLTPELQAKYPELQKELEALKTVPKDQKKAKMDSLKTKYPELATMKKGKDGKGHGFEGGKGGFGKPGFGGPGFAGHGGPRFGPGMDFASTNPQLKADLDALGKKHKEEMDAIFAKYPDVKAKMDAKKAEMDAKKKEMDDKFKLANPELAAELEKLKALNLAPADMKAKMDELRKKFPMKFDKTAFKDGKGHGFEGGKGGFGKPGFGGHGGFGFGPGMDSTSTNPQLKADLEALGKKHMEEMQAIFAKYPDVKAKMDAKKAEMDAKKKEMDDKFKLANPELAAELEKLKALNLAPADMKVKMDELRKKFPMKFDKNQKK